MKIDQIITEMDKSQTPPGRDGHISHSTYGSRDQKDPDAGKKQYYGTVAKPQDVVAKASDILAKQMDQAHEKDVDNGSLKEFAPSDNAGGGGNYLKALASAWYNGTFNTGNLHKGIKSQEDVEKILQRGIHCGDGRVRKYSIDYNANFDGVEIQSDDHYEYTDYDDAGNEIDSRTGKPWGPYDAVAFHDQELDENMAEGEKVGNMDADKFDDAMARLKKLAGAGPLKTVWDPQKRVYKNVPTAVQPKK
jgi:hypothetical protein